MNNEIVLRETAEMIPEEYLYRGIRKICYVEYFDGREELRCIDDSMAPPTSLMNYNKTWRLWTFLPTEAQKAATPWNIEVNE